MSEYKFKLYIPFGGNPELLNKAIASIIPQINEFSSYEGKKIVVINNTCKPIIPLLEHPEAVDVWELPFEISHAEENNWMIKDVLATGQPFVLSTHTDSELLPGAMQALIAGYEQRKGTKWYAMGIGSAIFVAFNPQFFVEENVWFDTFLFPFYYMDNHMGRIAMLRGWGDSLVTLEAYEGALIKHVSSHYLKEDPIFRRKNDIAFRHHGAIYSDIWGGLPGHETVTDPYASGTLPRP
jgi:hypothetical protein